MSLGAGIPKIPGHSLKKLGVPMKACALKGAISPGFRAYSRGKPDERLYTLGI